MKKYIKLILAFVLGIFSATGIAFAYQISCKNVMFKSTDWNVKNVEEAVNYLKDEGKCVGLSSKIIKIKNGDINTIGSVIQIGNEDFYLIGQGTGEESGKIKLLAKYNLKDNSQVLSNPTTLKFSETNYWSGLSLTYEEPYPYVYNSNSNLYSIVNNYVDKIKTLGISSATGRLMTYEEASALPVDVVKSPENTYYWLGSAFNTRTLWRVSDAGSIDHRTFDTTTFGIRPIITISNNEL